MEAKKLSLVGLAVAVLAVILAVVALVARPEGAGDVRQDVAALKTGVSELRGELAKTSSAAGEASMKLAKLTSRAAALERQVSSLATRPEPEVPEVNEEKLRELAREEVQRGAREMMERFRGAWGGRGGRGGRGMNAESLREELGLDEEKAKQVVELRRKMTEGTREIWRQNRGGDREKNVKLMNELRRKTDEEVAGLLTPEQMEKYKAMQDRGGGRRGRGRDRRARDERREEAAGNAPVF